MGVSRKAAENPKKVAQVKKKLGKSPPTKVTGAKAVQKKGNIKRKTEKPAVTPTKKTVPASPVSESGKTKSKSSKAKNSSVQKVNVESVRPTHARAAKKGPPSVEGTVEVKKKNAKALKIKVTPKANKLSPKMQDKKAQSAKSLKTTPGKKKKRHARSHLKKAVERNRGVVYFSHLPHGFYEKELKEYCSQFGAVTGVYLPKSENDNAKGFAFVEFAHPEVAGVVAETMNNYLMLNRLIKAKLVPIEQQKPWIFTNGVSPVKVAQKRKADALAARERTLTPEEEAAYKKRNEKKIKQLKSRLEKKGLSYDFTVVS